MSGDIRIYDLHSGDETSNWRTSPPEFNMAPGLAWRGDGGALAVTVADNPPCMRGGGTIYIFDPISNQVSKTFRVSLLPASIAFGTSNSLYVASDTCGGFFTHWTLDLPIFDAASGREAG